MFKKIAYFFAISLVILPKVYGMVEDELLKEIDKFVTQQKQPKEEKPPEGWGSYLTQKTGTFIRYLGDGMREYVHKKSGNTIRWVGGCLVEEEPTLERTIRNFWLDVDPLPDTETIFTSTAYALYSSTVLKEGLIDNSAAFKVTDGYERFIKAWNQSSQTVPCEDADSQLNYLLNGIIKALVRQKVVVQRFEDIERILLVHNISLSTFVFTRDITEESVSQKYKRENNGFKLTAQGLNAKFAEAREEAFMLYLRNIYAKEQNVILLK